MSSATTDEGQYIEEFKIRKVYFLVIQKKIKLTILPTLESQFFVLLIINYFLSL